MKMIQIGLTGWGDHHTLYPVGTTPRDKLQVYSGHFPVVEVDSSFYAVPSEKSVNKWIGETPDRFEFIVKAYQGMTGHQRGKSPFDHINEMYSAFLQFIEPIRQENKLAAVLFQFPPWFDCSKEHVQYLRLAKEKMGDIPVVLEFRNQSWFRNGMREKTLEFMRTEGWIHSICDEPQAGESSVPTVLSATHPDKTVVRFHGRNVHGWINRGQPNWRDVRYLYRYNEEELREWKENIHQLQKQTKKVYVLFNNNSGGDAADNAKQFMNLLQIKYTGLAPRQMNLFEEIE